MKSSASIAFAVVITGATAVVGAAVVVVVCFGGAQKTPAVSSSAWTLDDS